TYWSQPASTRRYQTNAGGFWRKLNTKSNTPSPSKSPMTAPVCWVEPPGGTGNSPRLLERFCQTGSAAATQPAVDTNNSNLSRTRAFMLECWSKVTLDFLIWCFGYQEPKHYHSNKLREFVPWFAPESTKEAAATICCGNTFAPCQLLALFNFL